MVECMSKRCWWGISFNTCFQSVRDWLMGKIIAAWLVIADERVVHAHETQWCQQDVKFVVTGDTAVYPWQWRHNEHHGVSNQRQLDCLFNRLFRLTSNKHETRVTDRLWRESTGDRWIPLTKGQSRWNFFMAWRQNALWQPEVLSADMIDKQWTDSHYIAHTVFWQVSSRSNNPQSFIPRNEDPVSI